ncbi:uncharacterized protein LOC132644193 [Lycium barbarum]|uniref:uncharacterized protein LOC132644193 n=1 Tax=Lycium barbarum TaxID=112863 RepID=UPI00293E3373|nr:uncharacterized protein LOC132644193 [Lycium barbarum]
MVITNTTVSEPIESQSQTLEYNHPLFLQSTDVSGVSIISFQLKGSENYTRWNKSMKLALLGRNKLGFVNSKCKKENYPKNLWDQWERVNAIVLSWLMNSIDVSVIGGIV